MVPISIDAKATGENIKRLRKAHGYTVAQLAEELGFSAPQAVYHWQTGKSAPSLDNLGILSYLFHEPVDNILVWHNAGAQAPASHSPELNIVREQQADACCSVISRDFLRSADRYAA